MTKIVQLSVLATVVPAIVAIKIFDKNDDGCVYVPETYFYIEKIFYQRLKLNYWSWYRDDFCFRSNSIWADYHQNKNAFLPLDQDPVSSSFVQGDSAVPTSTHTKVHIRPQVFIISEFIIDFYNFWIYNKFRN